MLVSFDDELVDPHKVSFVGKIAERTESSGSHKPYTISVMFKYIVDGVVLSVVRESVDIPMDADESVKAEILKPVREYIKTRRKHLVDLCDEYSQAV